MIVIISMFILQNCEPNYNDLVANRKFGTLMKYSLYLGTFSRKQNVTLITRIVAFERLHSSYFSLIAWFQDDPM